MSDLIDRDAVREFIKSYRNSTDVAFDMEKHLDEIPAAPRWVRCEEPPKKNESVLVRDEGYRVLTYLGDGRWEDDYGYDAEFVSDDAEWCYIEPQKEGE